MALMKYDTANNEPFITPTHGLYPQYVISVEEFKDRNARIMKNRWIDTSYGAKVEKIYKLFNPDIDGEIVKESLQEWLCDHRHEITQSIGIALRNHEISYAEWFRYINDQSGPDELALYSLLCKHGIHTSVFNKSYVWMTLMNHVNRTDDKIISLSGINLVYLGATTYGIIRDIRTCSPTQHHQKCQDRHRNVLARLHAGATLAVTKPVGKVVQVVAMEIMAKHHKHSANQDKRTMVYLLQM